MTELPHIDEHAVDVEGSATDAWAAVLHVMGRSSSNGANEVVARTLGCADTRAGGPRPLSVGSTLAGFHVTAASLDEGLHLHGSHRFSRYALIFRVDDLGEDHSRVRAETRAEFPGVVGGVYRTLVIGTRGHLVAVRRLLGAIRRRAESSPDAGRASA